MADPIEDQLADELGSIASFIERVARTPAFEPGELIDIAECDPDLELSERIGAGGVGVVYLARDRKLDREVAVKVQRVSGNDEADERLLAEARSLARLSHPNVVSVFEVRRVGGHLLVLMELVRGPTLREWLEPGDRERDEILASFAAAGAGLAAAHRAGVVHRDFKPDNVIVGDDGRVRVVDFGMAGAEGERERGGTPAYMAPEQAAGEAVDARADQYAWCVSLLEAITGAPDGDAAEIDPRWLRRAIERGLSRDPDDRWPDMAALLAAARPPRRWPLLAGVLAAVAVAALIAGSRGCAESIGLSVGNAVSERLALAATREVALDHIASGHLLQAADALAELHGRIDDPVLGYQLGSAMTGIDSFIREVRVELDGVIDDIQLRGDGARLALVSNGTVRLVNPASDEIVLTTDGEKARFVDGDRLLLTTKRTGQLSVWDSQSGEPRRTMSPGLIGEIATGGDVVLVAATGALHAYSLRDGSALFAIPTKGEPIGGLSVSADGQRMLVARTLTTIYGRNGEILLRAAKANLTARGQLAPDGTQFAMATPRSVVILEASGARLAELTPIQGAMVVNHSSDGRRLLAVDGRQSCIWSLESRRLSGCWARMSPAVPARTPTLDRIAESRSDGTVELRDGSGRRRAVLAAHPQGPVIARLTDDGSRVMTAGIDGRLRVWRGDVDTLESEIKHPGRAASIHGGRLLVSNERELEIWDLDRADKPIRELRSEGGYGRAAAISGDGGVVAWAGQTWDVASGEVIAEVERWNPRAFISVDQRGAQLFACGDGQCRALDVRTGAETWQLDVAEPLGMAAVPAAGVSATPHLGPDGDLVLTGMGSDIVIAPDTGTIKMRLKRETRTFGMSRVFLAGRRVAIADSHKIYIAQLDGGEVRSLAGLGHGLVAHPDGQRLVIAVKGGALIVDLRDDRRLRVNVAIEPSNGAAISPDGALLALGRGIGLIEIFDVATGRKIADRSAGDFVNSLYFTPSGRLVALLRSRTLVWRLPVETRSAAQVRAAIDRVSSARP